jgi:hypothetical protein
MRRKDKIKEIWIRFEDDHFENYMNIEGRYNESPNMRTNGYGGILEQWQEHYVAWCTDKELHV